MAVQEAVKTRQFLAVGITIAVDGLAIGVAIAVGITVLIGHLAVGVTVAIVLLAVVPIFRLHESVGVFSDFLANRWMVLQISLQRRMVLRKFLVIYERRIFAKLLGRFAMVIQKLIEIRELLSGGITVASDIAIAIVLAAVEAVLLPHESVRIFLDFLANCRMVLQISLQRSMVLHKFLVIYKRRIFAKLLGNFAVAVQELIEIR